MTEVRYEPRKEIIIHEYTRYSDVEELITKQYGILPPGTIGFPPPLRWVDGIVLLFNSIPPVNDIIIKEILDGKIHWDYMCFAPMEKYVPRVTTKDGTTCSIIDVSNNEVFKKVAEFIKKKLL
jgi:hypothetical protein